MELFLLYVWLKLDTVVTAATIGGMVSLLLLGGTGFIFCASEGEVKAVRTAKWAALAASVLISLSMALPTSKQMAYLVGGYVALKLVDSPETQKIVAILRNKANEYLDAELAPKEKAK